MKHSSCSTACAAMNWIICLLLFLTTLASLVGVYKVHFLSGGMSFGTTNASLAILAFVASLTLWSKWMCRCLCVSE